MTLNGERESRMSGKAGWLLVALLGGRLCTMEVCAEITAPAPGDIETALADTRRPADQVKLDATRKPAALIAFAGVRAGDRIADFMPGNAYFTRILSDVVGSTGRVYAYIPTEQIANCPASEIAGAQSVGRDPGYANVTMLTGTLADFRMPELLDLIWTAHVSPERSRQRLALGSILVAESTSIKESP
jgi:predicted methyltransferase